MPKPTSLPDHWPNPLQEDLDKNPQRRINIGSPQDYSFCKNTIKTSKYEIYSFLGLFLMEEFDPNTKIANCYFLTIAGMQAIPDISNTNGYPTVLIPLLAVLVIAGIFKVIEDMARHKADKKANSSETEVFDPASPTEFRTVLWSEVQVGDFIKVSNRCPVPADLLVMQVAEPNPELPKGICYIETKSLDGETNLKIRNVLPSLLGKINSTGDLKDISGRVEMEHPNNLIDTFTGVLDAKGNIGRSAINPNNVILRGCSLRNTDWIVGLVLNTGHDVKIMQSKNVDRFKASNLDHKATSQIVGVILMLLWVCFSGATAQAMFNAARNIHNYWYLDYTGDKVVLWIIQFFYLLLLHASKIPVSLYVSMAIIRFTQSYFMHNDLEMYYEPIDAPCLVRTMTLNEDLGQVSHIFSDKTGTLTCNNMNFRKASINGVSYGLGITEIGRAAWKLLGKAVPAEVLAAEEAAALLGVPHVVFYDPSYYLDMGIPDPSNTTISTSNTHLREALPQQRGKIAEFYKFLSVCHEVIAERIEGGAMRLSASNPDDEALVCAAAYFGYEFRDREGKVSMVYEAATDNLLEIEVLYTIPFTSKRKRMSVVIRDTDNTIKVLTKGADSMMFTRVQDSPESEIYLKTKADITKFSQEGLRCLLVAATTVDEKRYMEWSRHYDEANTNLAELDKRKRGEKNDIDVLEDFIEQGLNIVGATAIEDRLQEGVPECIEKLVEAGINLWVLTGDKEETAINIAVACNLVLPKEYMDQLIINSSTAPDIETVKKLIHSEIMMFEAEFGEGTLIGEAETPSAPEIKSNSKWKPRSLIIDGPSLIFIMTDPEAKDMLLRFSQTCQAVVCCRVSPDQKREIVDLIKTGVPGVRTLAVGDGANDVAMIKEAHIGVGIKGEEGVQAVNASDYAVGQFRFLTYLILKHGRYNYIRMSKLVCYMFYKNIFNSFTLFWFSFFCAFSAEKLYTEAAIQFFNLFYTSIPILLYGTYDKDVCVEDVMRYPRLYTPCIHDHFFNSRIFWGWVGTALLESIICCVLPFFYLMNGDYRTGDNSSYLAAGALCFTTVVIIVNFKMFLFQVEWYSLQLIMIILSIGTWIGVAYIVSASIRIDADFYFVWSRLLKTGTFWLALLLQVVTIELKDLVFSSLRRFSFYDERYILQEMYKYGTGHHAKSTSSSSRIPPPVRQERDHSNSYESINVHGSTDDEVLALGSGGSPGSNRGEGILPFELATDSNDSERWQRGNA